MKKTYLIAGAVALALAGGGAWWWTQRDSAADVQYRTGKIERGSLLATVSASGAVNPVTQVSVGTQVSGQIKELFVDFNSLGKAGQLIAVFDPETFEYRVRSAQADVDAARAAVMTAQAKRGQPRQSPARNRPERGPRTSIASRAGEKQFIARARPTRPAGAQRCQKCRRWRCSCERAGQRGAARGGAGAGPHRPGAHAHHLAGERHRDQARH
jgi:HlyD family secretion protein